MGKGLHELVPDDRTNRTAVQTAARQASAGSSCSAAGLCSLSHVHVWAPPAWVQILPTQFTGPSLRLCAVAGSRFVCIARLIVDPVVDVEPHAKIKSPDALFIVTT